MRCAALLLLCALAALPPASATGSCTSADSVYVCVGDFDRGCASTTGAYAYVGGLAPIAVVNAQGVDYGCGSTAEAITVSGYVAGQTVAARWWNGATCFVEVRAAGNGQQTPCPAGGPPNPGWGNVLP